MENQDKKQLDKLKEQFSKGNRKNGGKKPGGPNRKFNFYWIYAAIFLAFIGIQIVGSINNAVEPTNFSEFEEMLVDGDVRKITIVNEREIQVFIKSRCDQRRRSATADLERPGIWRRSGYRATFHL